MPVSICSGWWFWTCVAAITYPLPPPLGNSTFIDVELKLLWKDSRDTRMEFSHQGWLCLSLKSPPKTISAKYPHIFSGSYDCGDIVGRWWGLQVGYCAAVDNFGAMAPEIRLLPARSDIHPPLLRQKICHRKYCLEITSVKSDFIKSATNRCLQRRAFMHQTYWSAPLLNAGWAAIPFQERKQFSVQSKAFSHALQHNRVWTRGK